MSTKLVEGQARLHEQMDGVQVYQSPATLHCASINSLSWAPHEVGLVLATASSDGTIGIIEHSNGSWTTSKVSLEQLCSAALGAHTPPCCHSYCSWCIGR
jgi:hypothetical protein